MEEDYVSESFGLYEDQELIDALGMGRTPGQSLAPLVSPEVADADTVATPVVRGVAGGVRDAMQGFFDFTGEAGEFLQDKMPLGYVIIKDGNLEFSSQRPENMSEIKLPEIESGSTISEGLIRGLSQFVTGMAISPIGKAKEPLQFIKRAAFAESLFDPTEGNLATLLKDLGVDNEFVNLLDSKVDEDADAAERLKARLKQAVTGTIEGAVLDGVVAAVRAARSDEGFKQTIKNYFIEAGKAADARLAADEGSTTLSMGVDPTKAIDTALSAAGRAVRPSTEEMKKVLDLRAEQMKLAVSDRIGPRTDQPLFDLDYQKTLAPQKETPVPRAPEGKILPKFNRGAKVVEMTDQIASVLAERARPFVNTNVQFFYHTGPIIDKAVSLGIPEQTARSQLRKFAENYAATSPRTKTEENLRSASLVTAKQKAGIDLSEIIGPGGDGINEKGYPMMIGPGGIHQKLVDDAAAKGFNFNTNPKPATFVENVSGNHAGVTVDTHAIRAVFSAMNEIDPGSVPLQFIGGKTASKVKENQAKYQADPMSLDVSNMIADGLATQKIDGKDVQTEYAIFSDIYKKVAAELGVSPAEAQALSWFANGDKTGLGSAPKTIVELIDERVDVTAQALGQSKDEVFKKFMQGGIPLLSLGGLTLLDTGAVISQTRGQSNDTD